MQDDTHVTQHDEKAPLLATEAKEQPELIEIRLLDKIETIQSKAISR
ncbi:hypothetical protein ACIRFH_05315 [Streptomyces sp. NPDC093586]